MPNDAVFVFTLLGVVAVLMASGRVRFDMIALLVLLTLMLSGILTVSETLAGFGSPVVLMVAGLLIVGEMLDRTGVAAAIGDLILKKGGSNETRLLIAIMIGAAFLGAVMSSTAVVAIFIPIVLRISAETNLNASRLLMPMSYAALISGMLTLIATTPNLVVNEELEAAGFEGFGFFGFTLVGLAILAVAILYIIFVGRRLLPAQADIVASQRKARSVFDIWDDYRLERHLVAVKIEANSPFAGKTVGETELSRSYQMQLIGIMRVGQVRVERIPTPAVDVRLQSGDSLLIVGTAEDRERLLAEQHLTLAPLSARDRQRWLWELAGATILLHPDSDLIGKSLSEVEFYSRYHVQAIGLRHAGSAQSDFTDRKLVAGDSLFVVGPVSHLQHLQTLHHDFVLTELAAEYDDVVPAYRQMPVSLAILTGMVLLTIFDIVPLVAAVLIAVLVAIWTGCLTMDQSYKSISWSSLVLIAGMLPLADALTKTGGTDIVVQALLSVFGESSPMVMLTILFFLTAGLGLILSNTASAVLVAPIAIYAAGALGVSPYPFAIAVIVAASAAFSTPVSTPVVTLVVEPGRYSFFSFVKVGVPLLLLTYAVTAIVAPLIYPF